MDSEGKSKINIEVDDNSEVLKENHIDGQSKTKALTDLDEGEEQTSTSILKNEKFGSGLPRKLDLDESNCTFTISDLYKYAYTFYKGTINTLAGNIAHC